MIRLCEKSVCTGCMACYNACVNHAIDLVVDELGMLRPNFRADLCKDCGSCENICPMLDVHPGHSPLAAWALYTRNEADRNTCTSGGVSTAFARRVIEKRGVVFGALYSREGVPVIHSASDMESLEPFKGSKYVYCFPGTTYRDVEKVLQQGKLCLFVGTPCQVDGLRHFLKRDDDHLILVDLICHGTPPNRYLDSYVRSLHVPKSRKYKVEFRGRHNFHLSVYLDDDTMVYSKKMEVDMYFRAYIQGLIHRQPCYACRYAREKRISDMTIGDFWGLQKGALEGYDGKISVALVNTEKGNNFLSDVMPSFHAEKRTVEEATAGNPQLHCPSLAHKDREAFCKSYSVSKNFREAIKCTSIPNEIRRTKLRNAIKFLPEWLKQHVFR